MNIYLTTQGAKVGIREGEFYVEDAEKNNLADFPSKLVENIFIFGNVFLTTQAINFCLKNKIRVLFLSSKGDYIGSLISIDQERVYLKYKQWEKFNDKKIRLALAKEIINEKFKRQRGLLYSFCKNQGKLDLFEDFERKTKPILNLIPSVLYLEDLRGYEGIFSNYYFEVFGKLILNSKFIFNGRSHYPPKDEVNSLLSFGYTLLVNFITGFIVAYSLDPYVGFYHENRYKRENLSLDLMEDLRPAIDQITLKLINLKMIEVDDFEKKEDSFLLKNQSLAKIFNLFQKEIISRTKIINNIENKIKKLVRLISQNTNKND